MRMQEVDERDSSWEIDAARFRIYVFEGAANAVSTFDLLGATVEEALETARVQASDDQHLWSLALVHDDGRAGRGLVWLSGNDYNDVPPSVDEASYWRARGAMQDRYLAARSRAGDPVVLPTGERVIRFFPDFGVELPLWESFTESYPVERGTLPLSPSLEHALTTWSARWDDLVGNDISTITSSSGWKGWCDEGLQLLSHLRKALAGIAEVRPEFLFLANGAN